MKAMYVVTKDTGLWRKGDLIPMGTGVENLANGNLLKIDSASTVNRLANLKRLLEGIDRIHVDPGQKIGHYDLIMDEKYIAVNRILVESGMTGIGWENQSHRVQEELEGTFDKVEDISLLQNIFSGDVMMGESGLVSIHGNEIAQSHFELIVEILRHYACAVSFEDTGLSRVMVPYKVFGPTGAVVK